jgi:hypothetical protein
MEFKYREEVREYEMKSWGKIQMPGSKNQVRKSDEAIRKRFPDFTFTLYFSLTWFLDLGSWNFLR